MRQHKGVRIRSSGRSSRRHRPIRLYRATASSTWYDEKEQKAKEFELHYSVARHGEIKTVRKHLADRIVPHFQQAAYRLSKRWIRKSRVKVRFEREQPALRSQRLILIDARRMEYRGRQWKAYRLPSRTLSYARRRRRRQR